MNSWYATKAEVNDRNAKFNARITRLERRELELQGDLEQAHEDIMRMAEIIDQLTAGHREIPRLLGAFGEQAS